MGGAILGSDITTKFLPSNLAGLLLWLSADSGAYTDAGVTLATDGQTVQQWNDQSGNNRNISQAAGANRPTFKASIINGKPVLRFDGVQTFLSLTAAGLNDITAVTTFAVVRFSSLAANWCVAASSDGTNFAHAVIQGAAHTQQGWWQTGAGAALSGSGTLATATTYLLSGQRSGSSGAWTLSLRLNGASDGSGSSASDAVGSNSFALGRLGAFAGYFLAGDVAEYLLYNPALSAANITSVESYLNKKYAIF